MPDGAPGRAAGAGREAGSGTVLTVGIIAVAMILALALGSLVRVQSARSTARTAADLAALAAAESVAVPLGARSTTGSSEACGLAEEVTVRNKAHMAGCAVLPDGVVEVRAERPTVLGPARATARAGPAWARGG